MQDVEDSDRVEGLPLSDHVGPAPKRTRESRGVGGAAEYDAVREHFWTWRTKTGFVVLVFIAAAVITTWAQRDATARFLGVPVEFEALDPVGATACAAAVTACGVVVWFLLALLYRRLPIAPAARGGFSGLTAALLAVGGLAISATWAADWVVDLHFHEPMSVQVTSDAALCPPSPGPGHACMVVAVSGHVIVTRWIETATGQLEAWAWHGPIPQAGLSMRSVAIPQVLAVAPVAAS